jgi:hypothetical protein
MSNADHQRNLSFETANTVALILYSAIRQAPEESRIHAQRAILLDYPTVGKLLADIAVWFALEYCTRAGADRLPIEVPSSRRTLSARPKDSVLRMVADAIPDHGLGSPSKNLAADIARVIKKDMSNEGS